MIEGDPRRVVVLGVTGSGKTTAGARIARAIGARHVELDALYWGPNWTAGEPEAFREQVRAAIEGCERWVTDGGYATIVMDITWVHADAIVWLDYPLWLTMWRLFRRTTGVIAGAPPPDGTGRLLPQRVAEVTHDSEYAPNRRKPTRPFQ